MFNCLDFSDLFKIVKQEPELQPLIPNTNQYRNKTEYQKTSLISNNEDDYMEESINEKRKIQKKSSFQKKN